MQDHMKQVSSAVNETAQRAVAKASRAVLFGLLGFAWGVAK
jgi:hypothetical protein